MLTIVYRGDSFQAEYAQTTGGSLPALDYVESLKDRERAAVLALVKRLCDAGQIRNREQFKKVEGSAFFEFKKFQIRVICYFREGRRVVLTHGFTKKSEKLDKAEIGRAYRIQREYEDILTKGEHR